MNYVNTVTGPVAASELGRTLMHEHFLFGFCGFQGDATLGGFKEEEYTRDCLKAVDDARAYGINTIVDATTNECGRNVRFLKKISDMTGMNILCSDQKRVRRGSCPPRKIHCLLPEPFQLLRRTLLLHTVLPFRHRYSAYYDGNSGRVNRPQQYGTDQ